MAAEDDGMSIPKDREVRLWDTQWMNIVNSQEVMGATDAEDAVAIAVRMTEREIAHNVATGSLPPLRKKPT